MVALVCQIACMIRSTQATLVYQPEIKAAKYLMQKILYSFYSILLIAFCNAMLHLIWNSYKNGIQKANTKKEKWFPRLYYPCNANISIQHTKYKVIYEVYFIFIWSCIHINDKDLMHSAVMFSAGSQLVSYAEYPLYLTRYSFYSNKIRNTQFIECSPFFFSLLMLPFFPPRRKELPFFPLFSGLGRMFKEETTFKVE